MSGERYGAIVIGAGIIGCATAFELAKRGYRTLNVDKLHGAGYGSTSSSCAIIRFHYSTPDGVALARESYFYWLDWRRYLGVDDEAGLARYVNTGCLVIKTERNRGLERVMASLRELGVAFQELDAQGVARFLPFADVRRYGPPVKREDPGFGRPTGSAIDGAIYVPESGYITDPQLSCHNVQRACEARGGEFRFGAEVTAIPRRRGRVAGVELADGTLLEAPVVVNAAGPHSSRVNRLAGVEEGIRLGLRALKHEVGYVPRPPGPEWNQVATILSDGDSGSYLRPDDDEHVLVGSEDPECDELAWVEDPDDYDTAFTEQWTTQVLRKAQRIPELPIPMRPRGVVGLYDVTDDWIPIYDRSDLPGFYLAIGTSGNQFKNGPVVGKLMRKLIERVEGGHDHDREPVRMELKYTRREIDLGFYSRRRQVNPDSSFSVIG